ncbi:MAG: signal recognition particle-docking protein FtsY [Planctomycetes bacterium]|jgi:fused signal recognition particle receptor|nr:signal recognition particle-docking protein FtsY [Planctomycetota bacterium]
MGLKRLAAGLLKTSRRLTGRIRDVVTGRKLTPGTFDELEEVLISSDVGVSATAKILDRLRTAWEDRKIADGDEVIPYLKQSLKEMLRSDGAGIRWAAKPPTVILVAGVNGSGKTTSIAKLAHHYTAEKKKVILAAADTFRAAAVEQLTIWAERIGVPIVKQQSGADPAAVAFDAVEAAVSRKADILIVDTAGRLHTQEHLMRELEKVNRVLGKRVAGAPHECILVLDATTGQNAIQQVKMFRQILPLTGLFLAKLDGSAKGGSVIAIRDEVDIPVKFIGVGETPEDVEPFDPDEFVEALFS